MVEHERLIISPIPDWNFHVPLELKVRGFCLSYQYDFDEKLYGPYGFKTNTALSFLTALFPDLFYYDETKNEIVKKNSIGTQGVYFFNDNAQKYSTTLTKFNTSIKINKIKQKKGLHLDLINEEPFFSRIKSGDSYDMDKIINLVNKNVDFFVFKNFSPILGGAIILFNNNILQSISTIAKEESLLLSRIDSLEELNDW
ncbi:hypothetical protein LG71_05755 [Pluralibacter gergoviae]|uniref:hypothetical protein n=1 Tax=Pluralibacter gergoviae TaxID=61647 RepID=UPI0004F73B0E|nr:hypothetical protein [Pluralibacter gergoviae]AIQ99441.1 hypothetical protein LG71_05755 [Pluralibacter gergoviae]